MYFLERNKGKITSTYFRLLLFDRISAQMHQPIRLNTLHSHIYIHATKNSTCVSVCFHLFPILLHKMSFQFRTSTNLLQFDFFYCHPFLLKIKRQVNTNIKWIACLHNILLCINNRFFHWFAHQIELLNSKFHLKPKISFW